MSTGSVHGFTYRPGSAESISFELFKERLTEPEGRTCRFIFDLHPALDSDQPCQCFRADCHHGEKGCGSAPIRHYHGDTPLCDQCAAHMAGTGARLRAVPAR